MATDQLQATPPRPAEPPAGNPEDVDVIRQQRARTPPDPDFCRRYRLPHPDRSDCFLPVFKDVRIHR